MSFAKPIAKSQSNAARELRRRLAHNVHQLRRAQKLTVDQAADAAQIHRRHWHKVEDGEANATLRTLTRIAAALQVTTAELFLEPARKEPARKGRR